MERCGFKYCKNTLGPGAANVGYVIGGVTDNIRACAAHAWTIMTSEKGTFYITADKDLRWQSTNTRVKL